MPYGYSHSMAQKITERHAAEPNNLLFSVLATCLKKQVMPSEVAAEIGVSKQHVYNWINGKYVPSDANVTALKEFQKKLKAKKV